MGHKIAPGRKPHPKIAVYRNLRSRIRIQVRSGQIAGKPAKPENNRRGKYSAGHRGFFPA